MYWTYPYFERDALTPEQRQLLEQLEAMMKQAGEQEVRFVFTALLAQQGAQRVRHSADEVQEYVGCMLCGLRVEHSQGECQYWELSGKSSVGFNSDDVGGRALLFRKGADQWIELHYSYLQDAQVVQLSRLQLHYPAFVHIGPDNTSHPGTYICVSLYKDERHWPEWRAEEAEKEAVWQAHLAAKHAERMRQLERQSASGEEEMYPEQRPPVHIRREG